MLISCVYFKIVIPQDLDISHNISTNDICFTWNIRHFTMIFQQSIANPIRQIQNLSTKIKNIVFHVKRDVYIMFIKVINTCQLSSRT